MTFPLCVCFVAVLAALAQLVVGGLWFSNYVFGKLWKKGLKLEGHKLFSLSEERQSTGDLDWTPLFVLVVPSSHYVCFGCVCAVKRLCSGEEMARKPVLPAVLLTFFSAFVKAYSMALFIGIVGDYSLTGSCSTAFQAWLGFTFTSWYHMFWAYRSFWVGFANMSCELTGALAMATIISWVGV